MASINVNGKQCGYGNGGKAWATGQPAVALIHGAGGDHTVWMLQSRALAHAGWNVVALDLPGHGESQDDPAIKSVPDLANWVHAVLQALRQTRVALVGHSMGACVALTYAATWPQDVLALALVGSALKMPVNSQLLHNCLVDKQQAIDFILGFGHDRGMQIGGAPAPGSWVLGASAALLRRCPGEVLHRDFAVCDQWDGPSYAPQVSAPTLIIAGAHDRMTPAKAGKEMAQRIAGAVIEVLPGVGHMLPVEAPRPVMKHLRSFLDAHRGAAA